MVSSGIFSCHSIVFAISVPVCVCIELCLYSQVLLHIHPRDANDAQLLFEHKKNHGPIAAFNYNYYKNHAYDGLREEPFITIYEWRPIFLSFAKWKY